MDKLFGEITNATSCKSMIGGVPLSGDERCGYDGEIDECGYGYVPSIGGFSEASSSPVSRWSTALLHPPFDDFAYPVGTPELSSGLAESTASCGIATGLVGQYGSRRCTVMGSCKHQIWEAIRASSAAPYYLDDFADGLNQWQDEVILANNPTIFATREAQLLWPDARINSLAFESLFERLLSRNANEDKLVEKMKSIYASNSKLSDTLLADDNPSLGWRWMVLLIESSYNIDFGKSVNHARTHKTFRVHTGIKLFLTNRSSGIFMLTTSFPTPFTSLVLTGSSTHLVQLFILLKVALKE
ncbi:hypothetical protein IEQ34_003302 [Dendrobium chrysotoxum]|uniref:Uncharacterized protein n=1 Tax=Dendrobium chrysotoxum TaxID=161865 RepID=A0AAV7H3D9_DENCH|nr:hypothetical protein IEQ34_003302 [Dendrobium chrysotoxum]